MPGGDDGKTSDMNTVISNCELIRTALPRMVIVLLHHPGWDTGRERGSTVLRDEADLVMAVKKVNGTVKLTCTKDREGPGFSDVPFRLNSITMENEGLPSDGARTCVIEWAAPVNVLAPTDQTQDLTKARKVALDVLRRIVIVNGPPTFQTWFKALPKGTVSERRFYDVVDALLKLKLARKQGKRYEST